MSDWRAERLARQIRSACGRHNDDDVPVVLCVAQMRGRIADLEARLTLTAATAQDYSNYIDELEAKLAAERGGVWMLRELLADAIEDETPFETEWNKAARQALELTGGSHE